MNFYKPIKTILHSNFIKSMQKKASEKGKLEFLSLLKKSILLQLATLIVAITSLSSVIVTILSYTQKKLKEPAASKFPYDIKHLAKFQLSSQKPSKIVIHRAKLSVICGLLTCDMSKTNFSDISTIHCDVHIGVLVLILPDNLKVDAKFHEFFGTHFCDTNRILDGNPPTLQLKSNIYFGVINIKWVHVEQKK